MTCHTTKKGIEGKPCTKCYTWKPLSEFYRRRQSSDGLTFQCKICARARACRRYEEHRDEIRAQQCGYYQEHRQQMIAYACAYQREHREQHNSYSRRYYQRHIEQHKGRIESWRQRHPEKAQIYYRRWRARKMGARVEPVDEQAIYKRDSHRCVYCGAREDLTLDHIVALSNGGAHSEDNLVVACRSCNSSKRATSLVVWLLQKTLAEERFKREKALGRV